ncbi:DUF4190 domain-containing protein [Bacillus cereus]|uniref:DUF4190 domain-containing protein n=1 Tax=Bacillus cereus TaxID=1396 RepID=UPI00148325BF|nr:DUF4190 domain-containing protein [Bacillus cereus]
MGDEKNTRTVIFQNEANGSAVASFILGLIGFIVGFIPYIGWFMAPVWLLAIILGVIGMRKKYKRKMAVTGFILGLLGAIYKVGFWLLVFMGIWNVAPVEKELNSSQPKESVVKKEQHTVEEATETGSKDKTAPAVNNVTVPNLVEQDKGTVRDTLSRQGLKLGKMVEVESEKVVIGKVVKTKPAGDESVKEGSAVDIFVSSGVAEKLLLQEMNTNKVVDVINGRKSQTFIFVYYALVKDKEKDVMEVLNTNLKLFTKNNIEVIGVISENTSFKDKEAIRARNWEIPIYIDKDGAYKKKNSFFFVPDVKVKNGAGQVITDKVDGESLFLERIKIEDVVNEILDKVEQNKK